MSNSFYREFEDRHRGSRELIKSRLVAYSEFLRALRTLPSRPLAIDLGCGRGEWLEVLKENGFEGRGVDLDEGMLEACRSRGLHVENADAIASLQSVADNSLALVSAFHVVEHISFDDLRALVAEALRALAPGGLLIMETPNPENLVVGTSGFYLDPTHVKPIPAPLLSFVAQHAGFERHVVMRLQEAAELRGTSPVDLISVLSGVSPDYAVVAQKWASAEATAPFDLAFNMSYGLSLPTLAGRYDADRQARLSHTEDINTRILSELQQLSQRLASAETRAAQSDARFAVFDARIAAYDARIAAYDARIAVSEARLSAVETRMINVESGVAEASRSTESLERAHIAEMRLLDTEHRMNSAMEQRIQAIYASTSWRVTAPLRAIGSLVRGSSSSPVATLAKIANKLGVGAPARGLYRWFRRAPSVAVVAPLQVPAPVPSSPAPSAPPPPPPPPPTTPTPTPTPTPTNTNTTPTPFSAAATEFSADAQLIARQFETSREERPKEN